MDSQKKLREEVQKKMLKNKTDEVFALLSEHLFSPLDKEYILLTRRYQELQQDKIMGTIPEEKYRLESNRINAALLDLAEKIEKRLDPNIPVNIKSPKSLYWIIGISTASLLILAFFLYQFFKPNDKPEEKESFASSVEQLHVTELNPLEGVLPMLGGTIDPRNVFAANINQSPELELVSIQNDSIYVFEIKDSIATLSFHHELLDPESPERRNLISSPQTLYALGEMTKEEGEDLVAFFKNEVFVSGKFSYQSGFGMPYRRTDQFIEEYSKVFVANLNNDEIHDIIGIKESDIHVAISNMFKIENDHRWIKNFKSIEDDHNRSHDLIEIADVNGDGLADAVGFFKTGVFTALSNGDDKFLLDALQPWTTDFSYDEGWFITKNHHRLLSDINGDDKADIIGFRNNEVFVSPSNGNAFLDTKSGTPKSMVNYSEFAKIIPIKLDKVENRLKFLAISGESIKYFEVSMASLE